MSASMLQEHLFYVPCLCHSRSGVNGVNNKIVPQGIKAFYIKTCKKMKYFSSDHHAPAPSLTSKLDRNIQLGNLNM